MILENAFEFIDSYQKEILDLWEQLVNIDSGSENKNGVDKIVNTLSNIYKNMNAKIKVYNNEKAGNALVAEFFEKKETEKFVVLLGHMDTVFKKGTVDKRPFNINGSKAYGPGVLDMKGGIVVLTYALKALQYINYSDCNLKVILAGDEEIGHANSNADEIIQEESKGAIAAFNCETGYLNRKLAVSRKGVSRYVLEIEGVSSHAGHDPKKGRNAILEMAHKIIDIQNLTDFKKGTTFNVGIIEGGTVPNAVPDYSKIVIDVRFTDISQATFIKEQLEEINKKTYIKGTKSTLKGGVLFQPMQKTKGVLKLFNFVKNISKQIGFEEPKPIDSGGGSDSAYTVMAGVPTIDSMGPMGENNHSPREYALVESIFERTKLLTACLFHINEFN